MTGVFVGRVLSPVNASLARLAVRSARRDWKRSVAVAALAGGPIGLLMAFQFATLLRPQWYLSRSNADFELIAALMLPLVVATTVIAAFAVTLRRRARELGQLAVVGAEKSHVRRLALIEALVLMVVGAVVVSVAGVFLHLLYRGDFTPRIVDRPWWSLVGSVLLPFGVGLLVGLGAAALPAQRAASQSPIAALGLRAPEDELRWWPTVAASLVFVGLLVSRLRGEWAEGRVFFWGIALVWSGFVVVASLAPRVVRRMADQADRLPAGGRLAVRDLGRSVLRASSMLAVAVAVSTLGVMGAAGLESDEGVFEVMDPRFVTADLDESAVSAESVALLGEVVAVADFDVVRLVSRPVDPFGVFIAGELTDEAIEVFELSPELVASIPSGGAVVLNGQDWPMFDLEGKPIDFVVADAGAGAFGDQMPMALLRSADLERLPASEGRFDEQEIEFWVERSVRVYRMDEPVTIERVEAVRERSSVDLLHLGTAVDRPGLEFVFGLSDVGFLWLFLGVAVGVVVLAAIGLTKLGAAEVDDQLRPMVDVGAAPSVRRRFMATQAGLLVFVGGVLGSGLGVVLFWIVTRGDPSVPDPIIPWSAMLTLSFGAAAASAVLVAALFGPRPPRTAESWPQK